MELRDRALAGREGGEAGRAVQALLRAGERGVDAGLVEAQRVPAERRHAVDEQQRVLVAAGVGEAVQRLRDTGRGLAVDDDHRVQAAGRRRDEPLVVDRAAPLGLDLDDVRARAGQLVGHPHAEQAVNAADDAIAGVDEVRDERLHPGAARPGDRERRGVLRLEGLAQQVDRLAHDRRERGIHVADRRLRERFEHPCGDGTRAGAEQQAGGDVGCRAHGASMSGKLAARCWRRTSRIQRFSSGVAMR